jgi:preprotein translocase subunit SecD
MRRGLFIVFLIGLAILAVYMAVPNTKGIHFLGYNNNLQLRQGLDLQGGIQFLLQAKCPDTKKNCDISNSMSATITNLTNRVNGGLGVSEAVITSQQNGGDYFISVQLPGLKDDQEAQKLLGTTGNLEFIDTQSNALQVGTTVTDGQYPIKFTGKDLDPNSITVSFNTANQPQIDFEMQGSARDAFATYTQQNIGNYLTVTLDNQVIESAVIQSQITGQGEISGGSMTVDSANQTASILRYGALPLALSVSSESQIDATLGTQAIKYSETAAIIGLGLVMLFMLIYYRLPGLVAVLALGMYAALTVSIIKLLSVVLTLAGIAGVILSVGMAVDANILIFERIKEELRAGRTLSAAIEHGWSRAWPSIRDSNASTIITCLILMYFGNNFGASIIVGFATNLLIGVVTSLFTAVVASRTLIQLILVPFGRRDNSALFGLPKDAIAVPTFQRRPRLATASAVSSIAVNGVHEPGEDEGE